MIAETLDELQKKKGKSGKKSKKDVTGDGKQNFADVYASRLKAGGVPDDEAVKRAKKYED